MNSKKSEDQALDEKADEALAEKEKAKNQRSKKCQRWRRCNKVDLADLRKRLAVEKLKEENKVSER